MGKEYAKSEETGVVNAANLFKRKEGLDMDRKQAAHRSSSAMLGPPMGNC